MLMLEFEACNFQSMTTFVIMNREETYFNKKKQTRKNEILLRLKI